MNTNKIYLGLPELSYVSESDRVEIKNLLYDLDDNHLSFFDYIGLVRKHRIDPIVANLVMKELISKNEIKVTFDGFIKLKL